MPRALTHPAVYVAEAAGVPPTIAGTPTAVAAFVGRAARGPVDAPVRVTNVFEHERTFGGPWTGGTLGHAVRDYFANGGREAVIVRAHRPRPGATGVATLDGGPLQLRAASPGAWGARLRWRLQRSERVAARPVARALGVAPADLFDLHVREAGPGGAEERFVHLTLRDTPRRIDRVLAADSALVRWGAARVPPSRRIPPLAVDPVTAAGEDPAAIAALGADDGLPLDAATLVRALDALEDADLYTLLCLPPDAGDGDVAPAAVAEAARRCERRRAMLLVDPPAAWRSRGDALAGLAALPTHSANAALYFPRLRQPDPARRGATGTFAPCGAVAGVIARTDTQRGVWKAPAGTSATLAGVPALALALADADLQALNPRAVNALRTVAGDGPVVWGARTLQGDDRLASEWKHVPVRRLALHLEESIDRGLRWAVFEPNDEPLWARVRASVTDFLLVNFRQGALVGSTPDEAFFVRCDRGTMTDADVAAGRLQVMVGFAPIKPAEFVIVRIGVRAAPFPP